MKWLSERLTDYVIKTGVVSKELYAVYPDDVIDHTHKIILFNSHVTSSFHYTLIANLITPSCFFSKIS